MNQPKENTMKTTMQSEPIRLPTWLASLLAIVVLPGLSSLLTGIDWRSVLVAAIAAVIPLIAYTESVRARVDSPATVQRYMDEQDAFIDAMSDQDVPDGLVVTYIDPDDV